MQAKPRWTEDELGKMNVLYPNFPNCEKFQQAHMPYRTVNQVYKKAGRLGLNRGKRWSEIKTYHNVSKDNLAYFAGILDGEGHIEKVARNGIALHVTNTNYALIVWLVNTFGGGVTKRIPENPSHHIQYYWLLSRKENALALLSLVSHLLIVKKEQADFLLDKYMFKEAIHE